MVGLLTMSAAPHEILLVTPVWKDSARLENYGMDLAEELSRFPEPIRWMIADDGSGEIEASRLVELRGRYAQVYPNVELHFATEHRGKGAVVREAWSLAPDASWLSFVDADGSVTAKEMLGLISEALDSRSSVLGIRKRTETTIVLESPWRALVHRGFLIAVKIVLGLDCEDPQCGAKVLRGDDYRKIAERLREAGLAFDSELLFELYRAGFTWREIPVNWEEKKGGRVKPLKDAWAMFASLVRIRTRRH